MKSIRFLPLFALILAIAASAFTAIPVSQDQSVTSVRWQYEPPQGQDDPTDPDFYVKLSETTPLDCNQGEMVCQITADEDLSGKPVIQSGDNPAVDILEYDTEFRN